MGLYRNHILPRLIHHTLNNAECEKLRRRAVDGLEGQVVEVGFGSGLNVPFYPPEVRRVHGVDPSRLALRMAQPLIESSSIPVTVSEISGESLPFESRSIDAALTTWTLCTIPDLPRALGELRRVLKPGGRLRFLEHGWSPDAQVRRWQHWLAPLHRRIGGGCELARRIDRELADAGFRIEQLSNFYREGPKVGSYMYLGTAVNPVD